MKYLLILYFVILVCSSCNRKNVAVNDDRKLYNESLCIIVGYIVENNLLVSETDTMYFDPYARIDTNSIQTYGVYNYLLYNIPVDTDSNFF